MNPNFKLPIRYGLTGGLVMSIISVITYMFYDSLFSSLWVQSIFGLVTFGIIIFIPIWGTVSIKKAEGKLTFFQAFLSGVIIIAITMAFSTALSYLIPNVIDTEYPEHIYEKVKNTTIESMEKFGASDEDINKATERFTLEQFKPTIVASLRSYGISVGLGVILSLIIAVFVSRPEPVQPKAEE
ncbi:MAG: DUF4199 domain-containing protein [Chitinophagales bacterium]